MDDIYFDLNDWSIYERFDNYFVWLSLPPRWLKLSWTNHNFLNDSFFLHLKYKVNQGEQKHSNHKEKASLLIGILVEFHCFLIIINIFIFMNSIIRKINFSHVEIFSCKFKVTVSHIFFSWKVRCLNKNNPKIILRKWIHYIHCTNKNVT